MYHVKGMELLVSIYHFFDVFKQNKSKAKIWKYPKDHSYPEFKIKHTNFLS